MQRQFLSAFALAIIACTSVYAEDIRKGLLAQPITQNLGGATTRPLTAADAFTFIAANATPINRALFTFGNQVFNAEWKPTPGPQPTTDGLGPLFNRESCVACHERNGRGVAPESPAQPMRSMLMRLSIPGVGEHDGAKPVPGYGDQLQDRAVEGVQAEGRATVTWKDIPGRYGDGEAFTLRKPSFKFTDLAYGPLPSDFLYSPRVANPVIGLGLLEAVPEATLAALADPDDKDADGISGRMNQVWDAPSQSTKTGRFGWKANVASITHQNAGAARGDMGVNTPIFPHDQCEPEQSACLEAAKRTDQGLEMSNDFFERLAQYVKLLAVPESRGTDRPEVIRGQKTFRDFGCAACHMPTLATDSTASLPELRDQVIHPFTDLLIHDMGEGLADGRPDYLASGLEWRTTPLWGIGLTQIVNGHTFFLHDGRARNLAEAILWHGGEAEGAKEKFRAAPKSAREDVLAFLNSL